MSDLPVVMSATGAVPTPPATLLAQLLAYVAAVNPGYTANLPGSLIEDISSTDVGALAIIDQIRVDLINSLTPYGANEFLLNALGQIYGVQKGVGSNTSVYVVFSGTVSFLIPKGFVVSDGTNQYSVQDGGVVGGGGSTVPLFCVALNSGTFSVPANTVTQLVSSVPSGIALTCTNPLAGTPGITAQSEGDYRAQVLQAGVAVAQGMPSFLKTQLENVPGVQDRLVSIRPSTTSGEWIVICGGGDPYETAYAIFTGIFDITTVVGSTISVTAATVAADCVYTTDLNHGLVNGDTATVSGASPSGYNATGTVAGATEKTFRIGNDTTSAGSYVSGGVVTPNNRNITVSIIDYPDVYPITFVNPPQQTVTMTVTWNTSSTNVVSPTAVSQLAAPAIADYINSIIVGQPINVLALEDAFQVAVATILPSSLITVLNFSVSINGNVTAPDSGTKIIVGDPQSYFSASASSITVSQG